MKKLSNIKILVMLFFGFVVVLLLIAYFVDYLLLDLPVGLIYISSFLSLLAAGIGAFGRLLVDKLKKRRK